jgi:hypothetical protein
LFNHQHKPTSRINKSAWLVAQAGGSMKMFFVLRAAFCGIPEGTRLEAIKFGENSVLIEFDCIGNVIDRKRVLWLSYEEYVSSIRLERGGN